MSKKKILSFLIYILLFLNFFFLGANISSQIIMKGEMVTVPDLSSKTLEEAKTELAKKKLGLSLKGYRFHETVERGKIIFQDPGANSKLGVNKFVSVILSNGSERVVVPNLENKSLEAVAQILKETGLRRGKISQIHTPQFAAGRIIAQQPLPQEETERHTAVNLLISRGEREAKYLMPDIIGKHAQKVISRLREMEFRVEDIRYSYYPGLEPGIIIKQNPPAGYRIQKRNLISLEVSK